MDTHDGIDYSTQPPAAVLARAVDALGQAAMREADRIARNDLQRLQRALGELVAGMSAAPVAKPHARRSVRVDLSQADLVTSADTNGSRTSAAPDVIGWHYTVAILKAVNAAGPHRRTLGLRATDLGINPKEAGTALRNHLARVVRHLVHDGHVGLATLLDSLVIGREGDINIDRGRAPVLDLVGVSAAYPG